MIIYKIFSRRQKSDVVPSSLWRVCVHLHMWVLQVYAYACIILWILFWLSAGKYVLMNASLWNDYFLLKLTVISGSGRPSALQFSVAGYPFCTIVFCGCSMILGAKSSLLAVRTEMTKNKENSHLEWVFIDPELVKFPKYFENYSHFS